jgi:hypothetical protein
LIAVPTAGAAADGQISKARAAALQECNRLAARYPTNDWGNTLCAPKTSAVLIR